MGFDLILWLSLQIQNDMLISAHVHKLNTDGNIHSDVHLWGLHSF